MLVMILPWVGVGGLLYLTSIYKYLLFHSLAELFSVAVAAAIFMLGWNTRRFVSNDFLFYIGTSYLFVGFIDLFHTLAYRGMGVFGGKDANLPTQLWIAARYLQGVALLMAPLFVTRRVQPWWVLGGFSVVGISLLAAIAAGIFPDCYVEGLTAFKTVSEYLICVILTIGLLWLTTKRAFLDQRILTLIGGSYLLTILSEVAFTFYVSVYGLSNFVGHLLKIAATYLIYKALVETGLNKPFDLMFRDLKRREEELVASQEQLRQMAMHDALTGLPNRLLFVDRLTHAIEKARRKNYRDARHKVGVVIMDMDDFKGINDTFGHSVGDEVLHEIARRLRATMRGGDTVCRWGGDEFTIVLEDVQDERDVEQVMQKVLNAMSEPVSFQGMVLAVKMSAGISLYPQHGTTGDALLVCADRALYRAKEDKSGFRLFGEARGLDELSVQYGNALQPLWHSGHPGTGGSKDFGDGRSSFQGGEGN